MNLFVTFPAWLGTLSQKAGAKKVNLVVLDAALREAGLPTYAEISRLALYHADRKNKDANAEFATALNNALAAFAGARDAKINLNLITEAAKKAGITSVPTREPGKKRATRKSKASAETPVE